MEYTDLRNKTIFDFTTDEGILKEVLSEGIFEDYLENPKVFIDNIKEWLQTHLIFQHILNFSKITDNKELYNALKTEFKNDYPNHFRKYGDPYYLVHYT
jgi:hypothetical protein